MGAYNTYGKVQIKVGELDCKTYKLGDKVNISDGIYVGYGGAIVIMGGRFVIEAPTLIDKWGRHIRCDNVLRGRGIKDVVIEPKAEVVPEEVTTELESEETPKVEKEVKVETVKEEVTVKPEKEAEKPLLTQEELKKKETPAEVTDKVVKEEVKKEDEVKVEEQPKTKETTETPKEETKD